MPESSIDPYEKYTIADWKWEFLRRNSLYRRAYRAIEWLKKRPHQRFFGFGRAAQHFHLLIRLTQLLGLDPDLISQESVNGNNRSLPSPGTPAHEFERCPIKGSHVLLDHEDFVKRDPDEPLPLIDYLADHEVIVLLDTRLGLNEIVADLKTQLDPYLIKHRNHVRNYKGYLTVWDLRQQGLTMDEIAQKVWPTEYEELGGSDYTTGEKGTLIQRVSDHEKAAETLIEQSFRPRKRDRKIKK